MAASKFEDIVMAHEVGLGVGTWVLKGVADARLGGQMENDVLAFFAAGLLQGRRIGEVHLDKAKPLLSGELA